MLNKLHRIVRITLTRKEAIISIKSNPSRKEVLVVQVAQEIDLKEVMVVAIDQKDKVEKDLKV
jgi:hypothetical protein